MLDTLHNYSTQLAKWQEELQFGDIVSFRFPTTDGGEPKSGRPCLILDVRRLQGEPWAVVAYGTSSPTSANRGLDIEAPSRRTCPVTGLAHDTRFVAARRVIVPLSSRQFAIAPELRTAVLGRLVGPSRHRADAIRQRLTGTNQLWREANRPRSETLQGKRNDLSLNGYMRPSQTHPPLDGADRAPAR